ncbi:tripartite motif-containing protein 16-like protein [Sardina pilchardus]|uniref:tripartite motif-containing protein 16-like protein n=1 Tax=Sardina pilchardus TaxID=27697 RepID=UPI002E0DDAE7
MPTRTPTRSMPEAKKSEKVPIYEPNIKEPTCRAELMKYWISLSLDDKTANKMLWISDGGTKVTRRTVEVCPCLDLPERYELSPQVLCKQSLWGARCYWEVEYSGWMVIGATYEGVGRRGGDGPCGLGENEKSWALEWSGVCYQAWYNGINKEIRGVPQCSTIGVYIDQPAGIINFYLVQDRKEGGKSKEVKLLHRIETEMTQRILPGFWMGMNSTCTILSKD